MNSAFYRTMCLLSLTRYVRTLFFLGEIIYLECCNSTQAGSLPMILKVAAQCSFPDCF